MKKYQYALMPGAEIDYESNSIVYKDYQYYIDGFVLRKPSVIEDFFKPNKNVLKNLMDLGLVFYKRMDNDLPFHCSELCLKLEQDIHNKMLDLNNDSFMHKIIGGHAEKSSILAWIRSMFDFTKSASRHIGHMIVNCREKGDHTALKFWESFLREEENHWKIYSNIFQYIGLNIHDELGKPLNPHVEQFVNFMKHSADKSESHYAALLFMIETGPGVESLDQDPQFFSLVKHYDFPYETVKPLFLHTKLNDDIGHSEVWRKVICKQEFYDINIANDIIRGALNHLEISQKWINSLERI